MAKHKPMEKFTLRMLGMPVVYKRWQWEVLCQELKPESELRKRIERMLAEEPPDA